MLIDIRYKSIFDADRYSIREHGINRLRTKQLRKIYLLIVNFRIFYANCGIVEFLLARHVNVANGITIRIYSRTVYTGPKKKKNKKKIEKGNTEERNVLINSRMFIFV